MGKTGSKSVSLSFTLRVTVHRFATLTKGSLSIVPRWARPKKPNRVNVKIACGTWNFGDVSEYKKYFEKDAALARRFQLVKLDAPSVSDTVLILRGLRPTYERSHKVAVRDDALAAAAEFADKHIQGRFLPDKAIDLLDTACARVKVSLSAKPPALEDQERTLQALARELDALARDRAHGASVDDARMDAIREATVQGEARAERLRARWQAEKEAAHALLDLREQVASAEGEAREALVAARDGAFAALEAAREGEALLHVEVDPDVVAQVVSDWTGVPLGKVLRDEAQGILDLETRLRERIKGQDHALAAIARGLKAAKAGIQDPAKPLGVFLLTGPSGVGKTETALALADQLFGSDRQVVSINMSEFQERHTVSRLVGSPPGYVGYGEGGMLTEAVRQRPYSVVVLDEAEKAHIDVLNLFHQVFDKGILTDGEGKEISFANTIVLMASNLGSDLVTALTQEGAADLETVVTAVRPILSQHFKPALLARMTVVPYFSLAPEAMRAIVGLKLARVAASLRQGSRMELTWTPAVAEGILARCTEVETGARNIDDLLHANILPRLADEVLAHMAEGGMPASARLDVGPDGAFTFTFA